MKRVPDHQAQGTIGPKHVFTDGARLSAIGHAMLPATNLGQRQTIRRPNELSVHVLNLHANTLTRGNVSLNAQLCVSGVLGGLHANAL